MRRLDGFFTRPTDEGVSLAMVVMHRGAVVAEQYGTSRPTPSSPSRPSAPTRR